MGEDSNDDEAPRPLTHPPALPDAGRYEGPAHAAPYPLSRMAPSYALVDVAREIEKADAMLATVTGGKLGLIADQIRRLQEQAHVMLERARRDADLHRARCRFEKKPGGVYHLYRMTEGELWFSLLGPDEWLRAQPQTFEGTYRLELDLSFTRLDVEEAESPGLSTLSKQALLNRP